MKHLFSFLAAALVASAAWAQTTITLTVDMANEMVSANGVHVAGNFQGWDPGATLMTDNGDGTWSHTFTSDTAGAFQYKFINGNAWGAAEGVPGVCAYTSDGNRQIEVDGMASEVSQTVCYGSCLACGDESTLIRFRIDMRNEVVSPFGVHVAGDFQGWQTDVSELTDPDGDLIYESLEVLSSDITSIVYKFINGDDWTDPNESLIGFECADVNGNRTLTIDGQSEIILSASGSGDAYCFNQCSSCILPVSVTFTVDMSVVSSVSEQGVHIAGTFQGWDPESTMLTDNGDGTWSTTLEVSPGAHEFKFINGSGWNGGEESMGSTSCGVGDNRGDEFDENNNTYTACFNICPGESCLPDPDPANLTFQVDASELDLADTAIFVFGAFTGWQGGAIEMTDLGNGIWETTQLVSGSQNVDYKYCIGPPVGDGTDNDESGSYVLAGDTTTFELQGCGVENGLGGYNRRFVRSDMDEVIPLHCYNSCGACLGDAGCMDANACNYDESAMVDDGSCLVIGESCDDMDATTINDMVSDTCECVGEPVVEGCMDEGACNYDMAANMEDGSCLYTNDTCDDMDDMTINDMISDMCECVGEPVVEGCMDEDACNYDMAANMEDGSCLYTNDTCDDMDDMTINDMISDMCECVGEPVVEGCMDEDACNYGTVANIDDGSCLYDDVLGVCGGDCFADVDEDGVCDQSIVLGCLNEDACNYDMDANTDDGSCLVIGESCDDMDGMTINDMVTDSCTCVGELIMLGCMDSLACNFDMDANTDDESCTYPGEACDDMDDMTINDMVNDSCACVGELIMLGCMDSLACNFDMDANTADGSCLFTGSECDDMDVNTINDMINDSCVCAGTDSTTFVLEFERMEFGMFPNPTTGEVTFRVDGVRGGVTLQVMDGAGRVVWSEQNLALRDNTVFDLSRLRAGTYNVMLSDERGVSVKRLVIQR